MTAAAFDPGPWIIIDPRPYDGDDPDLEGCYETLGSIEAANGNPVCMFGDSYGSGTMYENVANARLVAAAPDLLEALEKIVSSRVTLVGNHRGLAIAAIAKTTTPSSAEQTDDLGPGMTK